MNKRKQLKMRGAGESGVAKGPETEVLRGCQMDEKAVSCRGVCGGVLATLTCVVSGRGTLFFLLETEWWCIRGCVYSLSPFSLLCMCVRACTCTDDACDLRALKCCVVIDMKYNFF